MCTPTDGNTLTTDDHIRIQQLYARYAFAIDLRDTESWLDCFTEDGELGRDGGDGGFAPGSVRRGRAELREMAEGAARSGVSAYHWNSNLLVAPTQYGASGQCYVMLVRAPEGRGEMAIAGYMRDELVKTDGVWRFRRRCMHS